MSRYLRIAVSTFFAGVCLALVILWVRSYWQCDQVMLVRATGSDSLVASQGVLGWFSTFHGFRTASSQTPGWYYDSAPVAWVAPANDAARNRWSGFVMQSDPRVLIVEFPFRFAVLIGIALAALPWLPLARQFSLRTILIATTLVALALEIMAWPG